MKYESSSSTSSGKESKDRIEHVCLNDSIRSTQWFPFWDHRNLHLTDVLDTNAMIARHDPEKLAHIIQEIIHQA